MLRNQRNIRSGLTLIETVVAIAIVGLLAAILLPAVQAARESARKTQCQNNLKQTTLALHAFHDASNKLPSHYNGTSLTYPLKEHDLFETHSWRAALLPYLEQSALRDSIDWHSLAIDPVNESVASTVVTSYICPSGASPSEAMGVGWSLSQGAEYTGVRSDYDALAGVHIFPETFPGGSPDHTKYVRWSIWGRPAFDNKLISGNLIRHRAGKFGDVSDGLSNTIMLVERGGRPLHMVDGRPKVTADNPDAVYPGQAVWSVSNNFRWRINGHNIGVNHDNSFGVYSDHTGGAYVALADGSVTFLSESTDTATLAKMVGLSD